MDAITLLRNDHRAVERHFKAYESAGARARATRRRHVDSIVRDLSSHAAIEEQVLYPAARIAVEQANDLVLESLEEHHVVKWMLSELDGMPPEEERFDAKVRVLIENVRRHVEEEEQELFPQVRKVLSKSQLTELGEQLEQARKVAPTHPHPRQPDSPPANLVAGVVGATADVVRDLFRAARGKGLPAGGATGTVKREVRSVAGASAGRAKGMAGTAQTKAAEIAAAARDAAAGSATKAAKGAARGARSAAPGHASSTGSRSTGSTGTSTAGSRSIGGGASRGTATRARRAAPARTAAKPNRSTATARHS